jgi:hypothetical protein
MHSFMEKSTDIKFHRIDGWEEEESSGIRGI